MSSPGFDASRVIADLRALAELTGGPDGARRVCWTDEWVRAPSSLRERLAELPVRVDVDEAGNVWAVLDGERSDAWSSARTSTRCRTAAGSTARSACRRRSRCCATWPRAARRRTVALVDWADEEGARFGRSLFGSSAAAGRSIPTRCAGCVDSGGRRLEDVRARARRRRSTACTRPGRGSRTCGHTSSCTSSRGRCSRRRASPSAGARHRRRRAPPRRLPRAGGARGLTPIDQRRDSFLRRGPLRARAARGRACGTAASARSARALRARGRHRRPRARRALSTSATSRRGARTDARRCARGGRERRGRRGLHGRWEHALADRSDPFDAKLIAAATRGLPRGRRHRSQLPSGPLHDAAEMARRVPTVMIFSSDSALPDLRRRLPSRFVLFLIPLMIQWESSRLILHVTRNSTMPRMNSVR